METYFMLTLDEYATASFTSFPKLYFGTAEQIDTFFQAIGKDEDRTVGLDDLLNTYARYQSGESDIEHIVAHQKVSFIAPVQEVLGEASSILTNHQWDHLNIWGCPYHMRCDKAESKHLWLMSGDRCYRVISVRFSNLCYRDPFCLKAYATPDGPPWGFPHQFVLSSDISYNRLFVVEDAFDSKEAGIADYEEFCKNPSPIFDSVLDDLFGDG